MRQTYIPGQRRPVLIRLDGTWRPATLRGWQRLGSGWIAHVRYRTGEPIISIMFATLAAVDVRDATACDDCPAARRVFLDGRATLPRCSAERAGEGGPAVSFPLA